MKIKAVVTDPALKDFGLPSFATPGSAAVDLRAMTEGLSLLIQPGHHVQVSTGLRIWVEDPGYAGIVLPRSGLGSKGLVLGNGTGLIDSDYQGPLTLTLYNRTHRPIAVNRGDRVAQFLVVPVQHFELDFVESFDATTERADGGFGSTGVG